MLVWVSKKCFGFSFRVKLILLIRYGPGKYWIDASAWSHGELQTEATSGAQCN